MKLDKLELKDNEDIMIQINCEVCVWIRRINDKLIIEGPMNHSTRCVIVSTEGMEDYGED